MIAQYIPLPMWWITGGVPQWYMYTAACLAWNCKGLAGRDRPHLVVPRDLAGVQVDRVSDPAPTLPRSVGPGTWLPNVHISCVTPGATSITRCVALSSTLCST